MQYYAPASATGGLVAGDARNQVFAFDAARTNLCLQSQTLAVAPWANGGGLTVPTTNGVDPRGTGAACTLSDLAGTLGELTQAITVANDNTNYVASAYFTLGTSNQSKFGVRLSGGAAVDNFVEFNPASGVVISSAGTYTVTPLVIAGVTFYRIAILIANNTSGNVTATPYMQPASSNVGATGTVIAFGAQFETVVTAGAATPSAYLLTGATAETNIPGTVPSFLQGKAIDVQFFLANGNAIAPIWANRAALWAAAGGGGGGDSNAINTQSGSGGAAGARVSGQVVTVVPGSTIAVGIGAGGIAGVAADGGAGGNTTFGALLTLTGGPGGLRASNAPTAGATPGGADGKPGRLAAAAIGGDGGLGGAGGVVGGAVASAGTANSGGGGGGSATNSLGGAAGGSGYLTAVFYRV
jgi:hypothetical protein